MPAAVTGRNLFSAFAATALSSALPVTVSRSKRITVAEEDAPHVGSYWLFQGEIYKVEAVERPDDWFETTVDVILTNGKTEHAWDKFMGGNPFTTILRKLPFYGGMKEKIRWLDDEEDDW